MIRCVAAWAALLLCLTAATATNLQAPPDNLLDPAWGTRLTRLDSTWSDYEFDASNLWDADLASLWRAADGRVPPVCMEFELARPALVSGVVLANAEDPDYANAQARVIKLEALDPEGRQPLAVLGSFALRQGPGWQRFEFAPRSCRVLRLTILSNHGSRHMTTLAGLALLGELPDQGPFRLVEGRWSLEPGRELRLDQRGDQLWGCATDRPDALIQGRRAGSAWALVAIDYPEFTAASLVLDADLRGRLTMPDGRGLTLERLSRDPSACPDPARTLRGLLQRGPPVTLLIDFDGAGRPQGPLDELAAALKAVDHGTWRVELHGAVAGGGAALAAAFEQRGVPASAIEVVEITPAAPLVPDTTAPWRALNSRIVIRPKP